MNITKNQNLKWALLGFEVFYFIFFKVMFDMDHMIEARRVDEMKDSPLIRDIVIPRKTISEIIKMDLGLHGHSKDLVYDRAQRVCLVHLSITPPSENRLWLLLLLLLSPLCLT